MRHCPRCLPAAARNYWRGWQAAHRKPQPPPWHDDSQRDIRDGITGFKIRRNTPQ